MRYLPFISVLLLLSGCQPTAVSDDITSPLELKGEMLFEGSNTLQMPAATTPEALAIALSADEENLKKIRVSQATIEIPESAAGISESLLLQIVSNQQDLITIGTLSPLPAGNSFELQLAADMDLLPYLKDEGCTWVLDLNLSEDLMDDLAVAVSLRLEIHYSE